MRFPLERFLAFAHQLRIPSKEEGAVPLTLLGTQRHFAMEVARGLEDGVHYFVTLKGRQQGFSTIHCALDLFWNLDHEAMQGLIVTDSDDNHTYFRDIIAEMLGTLPDDYRLPVLVNNDELLRFGKRADGFGGSRLMYQVAGASKRKRARLGRSRGVNYLHGDELGYWQDQKSIGALNASLARTHPRRLYSLGGTANGYDVLHEMFQSAQRAVTRRAIFIGWWRHEGYRVERGSALFDAYGIAEPTDEERGWMRAIRERYGVEIAPEQLAWYRATLVEDFEGNEDLRAQEHPCLPEEAFVSFGDKFIKPGTIRRMRAARDGDPAPVGYRYRWAGHFNAVRLLESPAHGSDLLVWEEPQEGGVYVLGAKPPDESSDEGSITVWRAYPDLLRQVAEYVAKGDTTYQFTWALIHLAGAYSRTFDAYLNLELGGTGHAVLKEMDLLRDQGWGLSPELRHRQDLRDVLSSFREYLFRRPDSFGRMVTRQWRHSEDWRTTVLHGLRDCLERGVMQVRSEALLVDLAAVRRGDDADEAQREGSRVVSAALAARHYLDTVLADIDALIPPSEPRPDDPRHVGQFMVQRYFQAIVAGGR